MSARRFSVPRSCRRGSTTDEGSASIEFLGLAVLLLIPLFVLIIALGSLQAATMATASAAREAARILTTSSDDDPESVARLAVDTVLADFGVDPVGVGMALDCSDADHCLRRGSTVTVTIDCVVRLPLVPGVFGLADRMSVPVRASATQSVDRFPTVGRGDA